MEASQAIKLKFTLVPQLLTDEMTEMQWMTSSVPNTI
jgi:hypothetical protein